VSYASIGDVLQGMGKLDDALAAFRSANAAAKAFVARNGTNAEWRHDLAFSHFAIGGILGAQKKLTESLISYRASLAGFKALLAQQADNSPLQAELRNNAEKIGDLAYSLVLAHNFTTALEAADEVIAVDPEMIFAQGNRAHALMFLGRVEEARAIYLKYRGREKVVDDKPWEMTVLGDFADLHKAGLQHPLMDEIEKLFVPKG
jgi:tetratricopeptide (TPR) repeat protein